jgi:DNA primase
MSRLRSDDTVDQIKSRLDLVEVVQQHVPLRKRGKELWGLCPFHSEKSPSFKVNPQQQSWHCFGCDKGGDLFSFVELIEKVDFRRALELLADRAGVDLPDRSPGDRERAEARRRIMELNKLAAQYYEYVLHSTPAGEAGRELLARRQVDAETARHFGLGYAPGGANLVAFLAKRGRSLKDAEAAGLVRGGRDFFQRRLMVPIRDERGQVVAFTGRTVLSEERERRKYMNTPETAAYHKGRVLFGLDLARQAIGERGHAVIMEGQFDVIVGHQFEVTNAVASSGTALTEDQVRLLKRYTDELVLMFDNDRAGRIAAERAIDLCAGQEMRTRVARIEGEAKDPDEFLRGGGRWEEVVERAQSGWERLIRDAVEGLNPTRPDELELALRRVRPVLTRIPDPAVREAYRQEAALWLGIDLRLLVLTPPVGARLASPSASPSSPSEATVSDNGGLPARPRGKTLTKRLDYLLRILALRPEAVGRVKGGLPPEDLEEDDRAAFVRMVTTLEAGGPAALAAELTGFPDEEEQLVRRAWASPPPRVDDEEVDELMRQIRRSAAKRRRLAIIRHLRDAERSGDVATAAALAAELQATERP